MMSPNKNKRGVATVRDASPESGPSAVTPKHPGSNLKGEIVEETVTKRGGKNQYGPVSLRSLGFGGQKKPAELFRKDLISAMKLADKDSLPEESYFLISDPWRQEWEKGVQVPVNVTDIKQAKVKEVHEKSKTGDFRMPHKLLHERVDEVYKKGQHELTGMPELADQLVRYDLDDLDVSWLEELNFRFREMGLNQVTEWNMERILEALENECHKQMTEVMKTEEGMGIEYDEDVVCDVCRSPESEEANEMVFCDKCDICIHQACYGIKTIPHGSWLCRTCAVGLRPTCMLCPNVGGAMKSTRSGTQWVHVSCALWIPEVGFGDPEKVEPVTKISQIPPSRWSLTCCLCKERVGACIQCIVKSCKTAFHVTCAFNEGLLMKTTFDERDKSKDVKLKAFCPKHSKRRERSQSESDLDTPRKRASLKDSPRKSSPHKTSPSTPRKELTPEEMANLRSNKLKALEEEFYKVMDLSEVSKTLQLDEEVVSVIFVYWKLKRKCNWDKPLLTPKTEEEDILEKQEEDSRVARRKMFVHLRHDLERARNLCYMISKREKMKRQLFHNKEHVFKNMARVLKNKSLHLSKSNVIQIVQNYHFDSVYDDYGRSVPKLPGELSEEENESSEMEGSISASTCSTGETESSVLKTERKTPLQKLSSKDEGCEGRFTPGLSRKIRPKARRKSGNQKKMKELKNQALTSSKTPAFLLRNSKVESMKNNIARSDDDKILIMSADESEDEMVCRLPGTLAVKGSGGKARNGTFWSSSALSSLTPRRVRQKKPRRGRKPWYEKQNLRFELTRNLACSTDDDEDTKESFSEEGEENCNVGERDTSEENVLIDVIGVGETEEKTLESLALKSKPSIHSRCQKPTPKRQMNNKRKSDKMKRTKSDSVQTNIDTRTKLSDVLHICENISNKNERVNDMESIKKIEDTCCVLSFLPTRTSNRRRGKLGQDGYGSNLSEGKLEGSECGKSDAPMKFGANMKLESPDKVERTPSSSLRHTRKKRIKFERHSAPGTETVPTESGKFPGLKSANNQGVRAERLIPSAEVQTKDKSCDQSFKETCNSLERTEESRKSDVSEPSEGTESLVCKRKVRQSSHKARQVWNQLLPAASPVRGRSKHKNTVTLDRSQQPQSKQNRTSSTSQCVNSTEVGGVSEMKVKLEKDDESHGGDVVKKEQHFRGRGLSIHSLDLKTKDGKEISHLSSEDLRETVKNGFHKRHSRRGKRKLAANGVLDSKQRKIDTFFSKLSEKSVESGVNESADKSSLVKRVLNDITTEKGGRWENHPAEDILSQYSHGEQLSGKEEVFVSPRLHQWKEKSGGSECAKKKDCSSSLTSQLDRVSTFSKGQCEADQFSMDTLRAFRSQSPSSDASTITGVLIHSRESTPRRFTRSQLADATTDNSSCSQDDINMNHKRTNLRGRRLKASKACL